MNNNVKTDEVLTETELAALEARMSVITDVNRSDSDMAPLSELERSQAQTFDKLVNLANQGIALKPVSFTIPSVSLPSSDRKAGKVKYSKWIAALGAAVCVVISVVALHQTLTTRGNNSGSAIESNISDSSDNYWSDSFDNQISEFEGEMICLSANYDNIDFVVDNINCIEDFSEEGDF